MGWFKASKSASSSTSEPSSNNSTPTSASGSAHNSFKWTRGFGGKKEDQIQTRFSPQRNLKQVFDADFRMYFQGDRGGRGRKKRDKDKEAASSSSPISRTPSGYNDGLLTTRSDSAVMMVPTHPLPLPVPEAVGASSRRPSSSSRWVGNGGGVSGEEVNGNGTGSRFYNSTAPKSSEHFQLPPVSTDAVHRRTIFDYSKNGDDDIMLNIPVRSAPTSGLCSPELSPRRQSSGDFVPSGYFTPQAPQTRSSNNFSDFVTGFHEHMSVENLFNSPDRSPIQSPIAKRHVLRSRNLSAPSSPLHQMIFPESSSGKYDNNVNVHPLPLPPVSSNNYPASFSRQSVTKGDMSAMGHQWQKGKLIGSGSFGSVYHATNRHTGAMSAMKEVNLIPDDPKSAECIKQLQQEIRFLSQLVHPNIVQYYGSEIIKDQFYIYLELVYPGSINKYARDYIGAITEPVVRNFTRHILTGLAYLHSKGVIHRDIKGANLLVNSEGIVKLADFGMAKHLTESNCAYSMSGTPYWMAPEVLKASMDKETGYNSAVDIWSLGCTVIEMFTGDQPWIGLSPAAAMFKVLHGSPNIPDTLSAEGKNFLKLCFCKNPAHRPSATKLLEHPFVTNSSAQVSSKTTNHSFPRDDSHSKNSIAKGKLAVNGEIDGFLPRNSPRSTLEKYPNFSPPRTHHGFSPKGLSSNSSFEHQHPHWQGRRHL